MAASEGAGASAASGSVACVDGAITAAGSTALQPLVDAAGKQYVAACPKSTVGVQGTGPGQYFFGTILPDFSLTGGVGAAVGLKSTWNAATVIQRYPTTGIAGT